MKLPIKAYYCRLAFSLLVSASNFFVFAETQLPGQKIGVSVALTGPMAIYGEDLKNAMIFANKKYAGGRHELIFEDDNCTGKGAVTVANKLIAVDKVKTVIGFVCSSTILAAAPIYTKAEVLHMTSCASADSIKNLGSLTYRVGPNDAVAAKQLYEILIKDPANKNIAIISEETDFSQEIMQSLEASNSASKLIFHKENYISGTTDFRAVLTKLKNNQKLDALIINPFHEQGAIDLVRQVRELQIELPLYSVYWPSTKPFLEQVGKISDGIVFVDIPKLEELKDGDAQAVYKEFTAMFGEAKGITLFVLTAIESFRVLTQALDQSAAMPNYLDTAKFSGAFGDWQFDALGESNNVPFIARVIKDGQPVLYDPK